VQCGTSSALSSEGKKVFGVIETFDAVSGLSQQVSVATLSAWHIEDARPVRQAENPDYTRCLVAITLGREDRFVLEEVLGIEI